MGSKKLLGSGGRVVEGDRLLICCIISIIPGVRIPSPPKYNFLKVIVQLIIIFYIITINIKHFFTFNNLELFSNKNRNII